MPIATTTRRTFLAGTGGSLLTLKYGGALAKDEATAYRRWEDLMRNKWTWDKVVRGSRGLNCTGHCGQSAL